MSREEPGGAARINQVCVTNVIQSGPAEYDFGFGPAAGQVLVGDWTGNGHDGFARRSGRTFVEVDEHGKAIRTIGFGSASDTVYRVGDWNGDGTDTFAVQRSNMIFIRNDFQTGVASTVIGYGRASDILLVGDWNADNVDTFAVRRIVDSPFVGSWEGTDVDGSFVVFSISPDGTYEYSDTSNGRCRNIGLDESRSHGIGEVVDGDPLSFVLVEGKSWCVDGGTEVSVVPIGAKTYLHNLNDTLTFEADHSCYYRSGASSTLCP
jgi:hypothetical protein